MKPINPNMGPLTEETDFLDPMALLQSTGRPLLGDTPELPITKNAHKGLSGNGEARNTIEVYDNGFFLLKTTVDANGRWGFTPGNALADGEHSYQVRAIDRAGNVGEFSASYKFVVDTRAPDRPLITQLSDGDSALANGSTTNNLRPTLGGDAEANSTVSVYGNGVLLGTTIADASGHWVFSPATNLAEQSYNFTVTATDRAGWVSPESSSVNVLLDATAPGKPAITQVMADEGQSGVISAGGVSHDTTPLFSGTAEARAIIKVYDGATLLGETDADSRGRWRFDVEVALATGNHNITVTATDAAGNTSVMSDAFTFSVESYGPPSAPSITSVDDNTSGTEVLIPNGGLTKDGTPVLHGTAPAGLTVKVYDGGTLLGQASVDVQGNWVFTVSMPLPEGTHTLTATSVDLSGTASEPSNSYQLTTDYTAPGKPVISQVNSDEGEIGPITPGGVTQDTTPFVKGTAEANARITLYDGNGSRLIGETTADASGNWSYQVPAGSALAAGDHSLTVTATDAAGNTSVASNAFAFSVELYVPPSAPSITSVVDDTSGAVQIPNGGATKDSTPVLHGTAPAGATAVKVYDGDMLLGQTQVNAQGDWVFTVPMQLSEGLHSLTARSVDVHGTPSGPSNSYQLTTDYTAPGQPVISQVLSDEGAMGPVTVGGSTEDTTPRVTGTAEANARITLYDGNGSHLIGETTADASGNWSYQVPAGSALAAGDHSLTVTATDAAGNTSVASNAFAFSVELYVPPSAPSITSVVDDTSGAVQIPNGGATKDSTPVLHGTAPAGATAVKVYDGDMLLGQTQVNAQGNWVFTVPIQLSEGLHSLTARSVDVRGTPSGPSNSYQLTTDYTAPGQPVISQVISDEGAIGPVTAGGSTEDSTPQVTGTAEAHARITLYDDNGSRLIGETTADASGNWSYQIPAGNVLAVGGHNLTVTATDAAGNISVASDPFVFSVVSIVAGTLTIDGMSKDSGVNDHDFVTADGTAGRGIYGSISDPLQAGQKVQVSLDGGATWHDAVANGTSWAYTDIAAHSADWIVQARITNGESSSIAVQQAVSFVSDAPTFDGGTAGTPVIIAIPEAERGYTLDEVGNGATLRVSLANTQAKAGDTLNIRWGVKTEAHVLTHAEVAAGVVEVPVSPRTTQGQAEQAGLDTAFSVQVRLVSDGQTGEYSKPFPVSFDGLDYESTSFNAVRVTAIPDAVGGYTAEKAADGSNMTVSLQGSGAKVGDTLHIVWGTTTYDQLLTQANITANSVTVTVPAQQTQTQGGINDFSVTAQLIDQDGQVGALSPKFEVVGAGERLEQWQDFFTVAFSDNTSMNGYVSEYGGFTVTGTNVIKKPSFGSTSTCGSMYVAPGATAVVMFDDGRSNVSLLMDKTGKYATIKVFDVHGALLYTQSSAGSSNEFSYTTRGELIGRVEIVGDASETTYIYRVVTTKTVHRSDVYTEVVEQGQMFNNSAFADNTSMNGYVSESGEFCINAFATKRASTGPWPLAAAGSMFVEQGMYADIALDDGRSSITLSITGIEAGNNNYAIIIVYDIYNNVLIEQHVSNPNGVASEQTFSYTTDGELIRLVRVGGDTSGVHILGIETSKVVYTDIPLGDVIDHNWETYYGTAGDDVVSISVDPLAYFAQQGAEIHGGTGVDTLKLTGAGQVLNLSGLSGFNDVGKISGIEKFVITGTGDNTLKISLNDVLNLGQTDLFLNDGNVQVMVNGNSGDRVELSGLHDTGVAPGQWVAGNAVSIGGTQYQVYQNSAMHAELLVQNNVTIELM